MENNILNEYIKDIRNKKAKKETKLHVLLSLLRAREEYEEAIKKLDKSIDEVLKEIGEL